MNEQENKFVQQEIAPCTETVLSVSVPQPVERKSNKAAVFFKLAATRRVAYMAVLVALAVVAKFWSIDLPTAKITLLYVPLYLSGILFGPIFGFCVGAIADLLGALLKGTTINPIITLGNAVAGAVVGLVFLLKKPKSPHIKIAAGAVAAMLISSLGINTYGLSVLYGTSYFVELLKGAPIPRIALQPIILAVNLAVLYPIYFVTRKYLMKTPAD